MAGIITALKFQKRNKERVNVYLDGEFAFGLGAVEAAHLHKGQVLSDAEITVLKTQDEHNRAFNQALRFLSYRPRSRLEIERYLRDKSIPETVIDDVIARLEQSQYLDDEAFARFWVENRDQFRPRGERALRYELRQKGISDAIIMEVLGNLDDEAAAWHAVKGCLRQWAGLPAEEFRRKVAGYLSRRGFGYDTVSVILTKASRSLNIED